jgi:hypothetical protein
MRNKKVLHSVKEKGNILHKITRKKANWINHTLRWNSLLTHINKGKIKGGTEVTERRGRRRNQPLGDIKKNRGS